MTAPKTVYFLAGLPRSGSTLLGNILAQNPRLHVTPTSGILDMLVQVRNAWDRNESLRAMDRTQSLRAKEDVLRAMLQGWFARVEQPVCLDKNRYWAEFLEMAATLVGGRDRVRVLMTVRDLRDVLASFERLYRSTSSLGQVPLEGNNLVKSKTALGRLEMWIDDAQPVGRAYNAVRDAVTRGWRDCLHFVGRYRGGSPCGHPPQNPAGSPDATLRIVYSCWSGIIQETHHDALVESLTCHGWPACPGL